MHEISVSGHSASVREGTDFATMSFAGFDTGDRTLRYVNAGQNAPLLLVPGRPVVQLAYGGDGMLALSWTRMRPGSGERGQRDDITLLVLAVGDE